MKWIHTAWTPIVNMHTIVCDCGMMFFARANFSLTTCPNCFKVGLLYHNEKDHPNIKDKEFVLIEESWLNK